jgi:hypothetical protein
MAALKVKKDQDESISEKSSSSSRSSRKSSHKGQSLF